MGHGRAGRQHAAMRAHGRAFEITARVSLEGAHRGTTIRPELDDTGCSLEITVPAGTRSGRKLRLRSRGLPDGRVGAATCTP